MKANKTTIARAGVLRCCLASVAEEHIQSGAEVDEGSKSQCIHCKEPFTLTRDGIHYVWRPDWQIELGEAKQS
jgi:hypothetical protein